MVDFNIVEIKEILQESDFPQMMEDLKKGKSERIVRDWRKIH